MGRRVRLVRAVAWSFRRADELMVHRFRKDSQIGPTGMRISCNHDDFTLVSEDDDFEIEIIYNRSIEGECGPPAALYLH